MLTQRNVRSKTVTLSTNVDKNSSETKFLIAICRPTGNKWRSKTLFLAIFVPRSSIVKSVFDCRLSGVDKINEPALEIWVSMRRSRGWQMVWTPPPPPGKSQVAVGFLRSTGTDLSDT